MDITSSDQFEEQFNNQPVSDTGRETLSTDHDQRNPRKTKHIRKQYQPLKDGDLVLRYEENPTQYKKLRKKLQNRESAARVRRKNKGELSHLEKEVDRLEKLNSELMLRNASLQTENRSLKEQVNFFRSLVKPNQNIDQYLNLDPSQTKKVSEEYHFEDDDSRWIRSSNSSPIRSEWSTLFLLTIIVGIFVIPAEDGTGSVSIAQETAISTIAPSFFGGIDLLSVGKTLLKYMIILGYLWFGGSFLWKRVNWKKLKKI